MARPRRHPQVANVGELEARNTAAGTKFGATMKHLGFATSVLHYLCFSTLTTADVIGYPDSKKVGAVVAPSMEPALKGQHWVRVLHSSHRRLAITMARRSTDRDSTISKGDETLWTV